MCGGIYAATIPSPEVRVSPQQPESQYGEGYILSAPCMDVNELPNPILVLQLKKHGKRRG